MPQQFWNVENTVTGEKILDAEGAPEEYTPESEAMGVAAYLSLTTGQNHVILGPHPKPHA